MELHSEGRNAIRRYTRSLKSLSDNDQSNFSDPTFDYSNGGFVSEFDSNVASDQVAESVHQEQHLPELNLPLEVQLLSAPTKRVSKRKQGKYMYLYFYLISHF